VGKKKLRVKKIMGCVFMACIFPAASFNISFFFAMNEWLD
jgi:hypothetical protein